MASYMIDDIQPISAVTMPTGVLLMNEPYQFEYSGSTRWFWTFDGTEPTTTNGIAQEYAGVWSSSTVYEAVLPVRKITAGYISGDVSDLNSKQKFYAQPIDQAGFPSNSDKSYTAKLLVTKAGDMQKISQIDDPSTMIPLSSFTSSFTFKYPKPTALMINYGSVAEDAIIGVETITSLVAYNEDVPFTMYHSGTTGNSYYTEFYYKIQDDDDNTQPTPENSTLMPYEATTYVSLLTGISINVGNNKKLSVFSAGPRGIQSDCFTVYLNVVTPDPPTVTHDGFRGITMSNPNSQGTIYYTLDGSTPTTSSNVYSGAFTVNGLEAVTLKAAVFIGRKSSDVVTLQLNAIPKQGTKLNITEYGLILMRQPYDRVIGGTYSGEVDQYLYFTEDGTIPTPTNHSMDYKLREYHDETTDVYPYGQIKIAEWDDGGRIGWAFRCPSNKSDKSYDSLVALYSGSTCLDLVGANYKFKYNTPEVTVSGNPNTGVYTVNAKNTSGYNGPVGAPYYCSYFHRLQFKDDTTIPTESNSTRHDGVERLGTSAITFNVTADVNIPLKLYVFAGGERGVASDTTAFDINSNVKSIEIVPPTTTFSGESHTVSVTINSCSGNTIYYTTDGSTPTTASNVYTEAFTVTTTPSQPVTVKAYTTIEYQGQTFDVYDQATYTCINTTPKPIIVPSGGTYSETVKASIYAGEGDTIYYTLDGSTPTTGSTQYDGTILFVTTTTTIKAIAYNTNYANPVSDTAIATYTISIPARSRKAPREHDNNNGIYVKNVTYSGIPTNLRSAYILPSAITVTDTEADVTWGYHIDNVEEDMGDYGTKCHVTDTSITIYIPFTHGGKQYTLTKEIPCTCIVQDAVDTTDQIDIIEAYAICTLENKFRVNVKARVKHTTEETVGIITDLTNYTLSGSSTNGNFICNKDGSYFLYDDILTLNYSGSVHPANEVLLTLVNNNTNSELDHYTITVTFETGSIFEVRDDAIRMAVQTSHEEISGVTNHLTQLELNVSGITGTVSALTNSVSGISADVSQLQQTASSITATVYNLSGEMVTHSEIQQISTAITMNVFNEIGEKTGIDISGGTITLDASKTIVTGELEINDGMAFYDQYGNPAVSIGGDELGVYADQTNGSINYRYLYVNENNTTGYSFTTDKDSLGQYNSGDTITYQYLAIWDTITPDGSTQSQWDASTAVTCQIQLYLDSNSEPFATYTATLTGATNSPMKSLRANPIREFTIPSGGTVYAKYAITSQGTSQIGTRYAQVSAQVGSKQANTVNIRKGGINIGHAANYMTFLGADDTVLRKGMTGFKYGKRNDANGIPQIAISTYTLLDQSTTFSEHPDNIMPNSRVYWTPTANYTWHTSSYNACDTYYGEVQGYTSYGDKYNARIREDKLCGDLWLDMLSYGTQDLRGERIMLLLPPTTRQDVVDNKVVIHSLPEGYTVRILNMGFYNGVYIVPNLMDGYSVSEGVFYLPNGTRETIIYFNANDTFIELVYAGTYTLSDLGMRQLWYVRNWNNQ